ncbi:MAG: DMT family transporter, partial [Dehalococcoidia bacterium]
MRLEAFYRDRPLVMGDRVVMLGVALAFLTATISGFAIFINSYAMKEFSSPTVFATLKITIVGVALLAILVRPEPLREVRRLAPRPRLGLALLGVIGGGVPFVLFFEGLSRVSSSNAAFIHKTLFLWVAILAIVFLKERLGKGQLAALGLLLLALVLMSGPGALRPGTGEAMILIATLFWAIEVVFAKRLLGTISSSLGAAGRMAIGAVVLLGYLGA